jgi:hypothetical protein
MASGHFEIRRPLATELTLTLGGDIDEETVLGCEREARSQLALVEPGSLHILWDLRQVTSYTFEARIVLVRLQRFLAARAERTVYVAAELASRSLALWAAHMGGKGRMCITADLQSAHAWLAGECGPTTGRHLIQGVVLDRTEDPSKDKAAG